VTSVPSTFMTKIASCCPGSVRVKAICFPLGEKAMPALYRAGVLVSWVRPPPIRSSRKMSLPPTVVPEENASLSALGETPNSPSWGRA
jgi:hypothetical protein